MGDFARTIRTAEQPFVSPQAFREPSYVTSCIGAFAATITFGAALLAIPLYLIAIRHLTTEAVGFVVFASHAYRRGGRFNLRGNAAA